MIRRATLPPFDQHVVDLGGAFINEDEISDEREEYRIRRWISEDFVRKTACPFCHSELTHRHRGVGSLERPKIIERAQLSVCMNCRYWQWYSFFYHDEPYRTEDEKVAHIAVLSKEREFETTFPLGCETELAQQFRRDSSLWHSIDPTRFEQFVASVFRANHRHALVKHVGGTGDGGVDVYIIDDGTSKWCQVKRRMSPQASEPPETIRNLLGALVLKNGRHGIVVSTADHFTYQAHEAARNAKKLGYTIELIDRGMMNLLIEPLLPLNPWRAVIRHITGEAKHLRMRDGQADLPDFLVEVMPHELHQFSDPDDEDEDES